MELKCKAQGFNFSIGQMYVKADSSMRKLMSLKMYPICIKHVQLQYSLHVSVQV